MNKLNYIFTKPTRNAMRNLLLSVLLLISSIGWAQSLYKVDFTKSTDIDNYIEQKNINVHYYNDAFAIVSGQLAINNTHHKIGKKQSSDDLATYLVWLPKEKKSDYLKHVQQTTPILYSDNDLAILQCGLKEISKIKHGVHSGIIKIQTHAVRPHKDYITERHAKLAFDNFISNLVAEVDTDSIIADIQHMEDYGTRKYNTSQAVEAQQWIKSQFENYGLEVELTYGGVSGSENVIAKQLGAVFPNKFVVVGGHYDSTSSSSDAPGADDNASGTAAVMEIARILSEHQFNYTIIYCAWTAEEIGLYGSGQWASDAAAAGMEIVGYLNLDMIGYLKEGSEYHTDIMAPASAQPLVEFYNSVVDLYVEDFTTYNGTMVGGDSDHTSFNNNGYMGIFPFEDSNDYSPYIHTTNDIIGPSVNNPTLAGKFTQAGVAFVTTLAEPFNGLFPPMNLTETQLENSVELVWKAPLQGYDSFAHYTLYRNGQPFQQLNNYTDTTYTDLSVTNGNTYSYHVTATYAGEFEGESNASNSVSITMGLLQIGIWDFEDGLQGWTLENNNTGWIWNQIVSIPGNSTPYLSIDSDAAGSGILCEGYAISPTIDLSTASAAFLDFDYGYRAYGNDEFGVYYRIAPTDEWILISELSASSSFRHSSITIPEEAFSESTQFAFYYSDNETWAWYTALDNVAVIAAQAGNGLEAPTGLAGYVAENAITLEWQPVSSVGFSNYNIYRDGSLLTTITNQESIQHSDEANLTDGRYYTYYVTTTYETGESGASNSVTIQFAGTATTNSVASPIVMYPNPAKSGETIHLKSSANTNTINLYDITGKLLTTLKPSHKHSEIETHSLKPGMYLLQISTEQTTETKTLIIK